MKAILELLAGLLADDRLEVADDHRERMRADHAADGVVRFRGRPHPVAHRLVGGVAQGARTGRHRHDLRAHGPHVEDVQLLAADVFLAHVDRAFQAEKCTGRGCGHAVLSRPRLGDHAFLAHAPRQHHLADRVVDLVGTSVVQVFTLEKDLGAAGKLGESLGQVKRRGPADVVLQVVVEGVLKVRIDLRFLILLGQPVERIHECLGHEPAAEGAEPAQVIGHLVQRAYGKSSRFLVACRGHSGAVSHLAGNWSGAGKECALSRAAR